jgi:hypothetical protein
MTDIVICSLPLLSLDRPPAAPALLISAVKEAGYSARSLDLNLEFFLNQCNKNINVYDSIISTFSPYVVPQDKSVIATQEWLNQSIDLLKNLQPKIIGISVFTYFQHRATVLLAKEIRKNLPGCKIVLGGFGLNINSNTLSNLTDVKKIDLLKPFGQYAKEKNLTDYLIYDNVFDKLILLLEEVIGISEYSKKLNFEEGKIIYNTPIPDYDDYKLSEYIWNDEKALPITGSKGCVRSCTFCDIPGQFGRFKYRSGEDIAKEIITLKNKYNIKTFEFTDSLVNGANKAFKEWLTIVAEYNDVQPESEKIHWFGQYICKPQKSQPADVYSLMARSGVTSLVIGVESGSDDVLEAMQKKMTVKDVYDELEQFQIYGIKANFLMFSGYFNETWERYLQTLEFLIKCQPYIINRVIEKISVGYPLYINEKMALGINADHYGIVIDPYDNANWKLKDDPSNNFVERCYRRLITQLILDKLGIAQNMTSISAFRQMLDNLKRHENKIQVGHEKKIFTYDNNLDFLIPPKINSLLKLNTFDLKINISPFKLLKKFPQVRIIINDEIIIDEQLLQEKTFTYSTNNNVDKNINVVIEFYGKKDRDTIVSTDGEIVENLGISINKIFVNDIDIIKSKIIYNLGQYFYNLSPEKLEYFKSTGKDTDPNHSLVMFENGFWKLNFQMPVLKHFTSIRSVHEKHVTNTPDNYMLNDIYNTILNIRRLEKNLN